MKLPRIPLSPGWSRLLDGLVGIVAAVAMAYGLFVAALGGESIAGHAFDLGVGLAGLFGVLLTCFEVIAVSRWRARGGLGAAISGVVQQLLGVALAAIAVLLAVLFLLLTLPPPLGPPARLGFAALSIFLFALAFWLRDESRR